MIFNALNRPYWFSVIFVTIVVQLHLLRNISEIYYLIYLIAVVATFLFVLRRWKFLSKVEKKAIFYIVAIFLMPIISILPGLFQASYYSVEGIVVGVLRIIFVLPIYLVILSTPSDQNSFNKLFVLVASVTCLAALSVPYQFIFGPIEWFAVSSERAGLDRFASLFGSLTALGGVVGFGILAAILANMSNIVRAVFVSGIILGAVLSLQKAAIANVLLALIFLPFFKQFNKRSIFVVVVYFLVLSSLASVFFGSEISSFLSTVKFGSDSDFSGDFSFTESISQRLFDLPAEAIDFHGAWNLILGVGPIGGSGAFGYADVPMSHNGFVDLLLVGGITYFLLFIAFLFFILTKSKQRSLKYSTNFNIVAFGYFCMMLLLVNMLMSGLNFFTPSGAMFFALATKCLLLRKEGLAVF